jgi:hypothetical protein
MAANSGIRWATYWKNRPDFLKFRGKGGADFLCKMS